MSRRLMGVLGTIFRPQGHPKGRRSTRGNGMRLLDDATNGIGIRRRGSL
jgi:hypothetical protein